MIRGITYNWYKMKIEKLKWLLLVLLISGLSHPGYCDTINPLSEEKASAYIFDFVKENSFDHEPGVASVYTNFIIKEKGLNYAVDFLITEENEILILDIRSEDEFYRLLEVLNAD